MLPVLGGAWVGFGELALGPTIGLVNFSYPQGDLKPPGQFPRFSRRCGGGVAARVFGLLQHPDCLVCFLTDIYISSRVSSWRSSTPARSTERSATAISNSNQQQQSATAISNSNQQQQSATAISNSNQQQQSATAVIHHDSLLDDLNPSAIVTSNHQNHVDSQERRFLRCDGRMYRTVSSTLPEGGIYMHSP